MSGLHVDSVVKDFGLRQVLSDVFISCKPGEIIGLLGRNGSGKSTLLKIIFGALKANQKFVKVDDKQIRSLYDNRNLIQYLPQDSFLPTHISIRKIISIFCGLEQSALLFEMELIKPFLHQKNNQLSGGERRLIEIFIMLYSKAKYVLLDEPFNGLAPLHIEIIKEQLRERATEKGFIITDHDYTNVLDLSTSIILLHEGETKKIKNHQELIDFGYLPSNSLTP
ncbi:MAG: ATP-binding cassette domain-containing protein [Bacteroidota bacterium]